MTQASLWLVAAVLFVIASGTSAEIAALMGALAIVATADVGEID